MKIMLSGMAVFAMLAAPAVAGMRYDQKLEKAAMEIVAGKIGDIRGGFSYAQKVQLVIRQGETPAVERQAQERVADDLARSRPSHMSQPFSSIATF